MPRSEQVLRQQTMALAAALRSAFPPEEAASFMPHPRYDEPRVQHARGDPRFLGEVLGRCSRLPLHLFLYLPGAVRQLRPPDQAIVLLHVAHEHPAEDVARWLRCKPCTVRTRAAAALDELARQLWTDAGEPAGPEEQSA